MLHSKYLTQEGMEIMLKTLYKNGWRYIFRRVYRNEFYVSIEKPRYSEDDTLISYPEHQTRLGDILIIFIADALGGHNYITIADHIDIVDWSTVKVDTPVLVKSVKDGEWTRRYFAAYKGGKVYTWIGGATSWSTDFKENISCWSYATLAKDEEN